MQKFTSQPPVLKSTAITNKPFYCMNYLLKIKKIYIHTIIADSTSLKSETQSDDGRQQNAYIPYMYARQCIMRISNDMAEMKTKHIRIVKDIEKHYRAIEDETQVKNYISPPFSINSL